MTDDALPVVTATLTYVRMKSARGDWYGETISHTRRHLYDFVASLSTPVAANVRRVRREHVQAWIDQNPAHSVAYRRVRLVAVRGLFRWLHNEGRISRNPTVGAHVGTVPESVPRSFNDDDVERLFAVARRDPRELVCVSLCWNEGCRRIEVARTLLEDLDFRTSTLAVRGKFHRGNVSRHAAVSPETMGAVKAYLVAEPTRSGPLVRSHRVGRRHDALTSHGVGQIVAKVIRDAGLKWFPFDGRSSHAGRHTSATQSVEAGVPNELLKRQYGWTSDAMIRRYSKGAALDLHQVHEARARRRDLVASLGEGGDAA